MHDRNTRVRAERMRRKGSSLREIASILNISKATASLWLSSVQLDTSARKRIERLRDEGRKRSLHTRRNSASRKEEYAEDLANRDALSIELTTEMCRVFCALLYACEGGKRTKDGVRFMNSDPQLIRSFLSFLRRGFLLDESKFRVCLHLHDYHKETLEKKYWSKLTDIPIKQFIKSFQKKNSQVTIKEGYRGCASVRYYDTHIVRHLAALAQAVLSDKMTSKGL